MISALRQCPICEPILADIAAAHSFYALTEIRRRRLTHAVGIDETQRAALASALAQREHELLQNADIRLPQPQI